MRRTYKFKTKKKLKITKPKYVYINYKFSFDGLFRVSKNKRYATSPLATISMEWYYYMKRNNK